MSLAMLDAPSRSNSEESPLGVLMVSNFLSSTGTSRGACEELADRLSGAGHRVITTSDKSRRISRIADMVSTAWRCRDQYDVAQVDIYSGSAFVWAEAVCAALRLMKKPYVLSLHGGGLPTFASRWSRRVRYLLGSAHAVTTPSQYLLQAMKPYRSSMTLIPNSIDVSNYEFRHRTDPRPNLIWLRSLHRLYNPLQAVQVLAELRGDYSDARLVMVGPDKGDGSLQEVEREAARLGVTDCLTLTGVIPKNEVPHRLRESDIFLNTANVDNTPISVLEALACGLCVVSTNVGGIPYLLHDTHDSLLTSPGDPQEMAAAVRSVLSQPGYAGSLSMNARKKTEQFDWSVTLPAWDDVLRKASQSNRSTTEVRS